MRRIATVLFILLVAAGFSNPQKAVIFGTAPTAQANLLLGSLPSWLTFSRADATPIATYTNSSGNLATVATATAPRWDYDPITKQPLGLLLEEGRTNIVYPSQANSGSNTISNITLGATVTGPDGVSNSAQTLTEDTANNQHFIVIGAGALSGTYSVTNATTYTITIVAKKGTRSWIWFGNFSTTTFNTIAKGYTWFNFDTGSFGTIGSQYTGSTKTDIGNGWWKLTLTYTAAATESINGLRIGTATGDGVYSYIGSGSDTLLAYSGQIEVGAFGTSLIKTVSGTVARASDVVQFTDGPLNIFKSSQWTAYVELQTIATNITIGGRIINFQAASDAPLYFISNTSVGTFSGSGAMSATPGDSGTFATIVRAGASYNSSGRSLVANNGTVSTDTKTYAAISTAQLGSQNGSSAFTSGRYRSFAIFNTRLSDVTFKAKSAVGVQY